MVFGPIWMYKMNQECSKKIKNLIFLSKHVFNTTIVFQNNIPSYSEAVNNQFQIMENTALECDWNFTAIYEISVQIALPLHLWHTNEMACRALTHTGTDINKLY